MLTESTTASLSNLGLVSCNEDRARSFSEGLEGGAVGLSGLLSGLVLVDLRAGLLLGGQEPLVVGGGVGVEHFLI